MTKLFRKNKQKGVLTSVEIPFFDDMIKERKVMNGIIFKKLVDGIAAISSFVTLEEAGRNWYKLNIPNGFTSAVRWGIWKLFLNLLLCIPNHNFC